MNGPRRYLAKHLATEGGVPLYGFGCRTPDEGQVGRSLMRYLGMQGGMPLYGFSRCDFPRIGRFLMRYLGMDGAGLPV